MNDQPITSKEWLNGQGRSPHQRLDTMAQLWGEHMEWKTTVDRMRESATEQLRQLQAALIPSDEQIQAVEREMAELYRIQVARSGDLATLELELADLRADISEQQERVKELETEAMLFAEGPNADARKGAVAQALKENTEYQAVKGALTINERAKLIKQAHYDVAEREYKRLAEQLRTLRARLEHWTARAKSY